MLFLTQKQEPLTFLHDTKNVTLLHHKDHNSQWKANGFAPISTATNFIAALAPSLVPSSRPTSNIVIITTGATFTLSSTFYCLKRMGSCRYQARCVHLCSRSWWTAGHTTSLLSTATFVQATSQNEWLSWKEECGGLQCWLLNKSTLWILQSLLHEWELPSAVSPMPTPLFALEAHHAKW